MTISKLAVSEQFRSTVFDKEEVNLGNSNRPSSDLSLLVETLLFFSPTNQYECR
jgi:hypothetical protein